MKTRLSAAGAAMTAAALAASALVATSGTAQAADTATITVSVVDQFGQPAEVTLLAFDQSQGLHFVDPPARVSSTLVFQNLPAGGYSFLSQGPWSGIECFGIDPCNAIGGGATLTPVVTVAEGGAASYTAQVIMPTVTGGPSVGTPLTIQTGAGYKKMQAAAAQQTGASAEHTQQWLRGTSEIPSATGPTYVTTPADAIQPVSARLSPSPAVGMVFAQNGYLVPPFTPRPVVIGKASTTTKTVFLAGDRIRVKVVAGPDVVPDGKIKLSLGKLKKKATLKNGKTTIVLPASLEPGKYTLKVSYLGSTVFEASKSKKKTLTVR